MRFTLKAGTTDCPKSLGFEQGLMPNDHNNRAKVWTKRLRSLDDKPPRVLVVDDNEVAADALTAHLEFEEMVARPAFGGAEAVSLASVWAPDIIVMDISMPQCNGFDASRALRADAKTCAIVIIAFTGLDEDEVRRNLIDHEFDGYCQKGQPPAKLVAMIWGFFVRR